MQNRVKMIVILTIFALVSGAVLSVVYMFSSPFIEKNMLAEQKRAIFSVVPNAKSYEEKEKNGLKYFVCKDASGNIVGYALPAKGNGYQGEIKLMIGLSPDLKNITGLEVLEQVETPGLGGRISEDSFLKQFKGLEDEPEVEYVKNKNPEKPNQIRAITGATISSRSVVAIINKFVKEFKKAH